ncbi:uncharacterized protein LOC120158215 isoform X2 [Hibiscus syriacus]|uniref:uncharacterized protein LOC120158215 isoform X2 n=1 Tax=Hibiscus syriacus TaxID=106335 RepID=UPI00192446EB|nr:uncharacterized protein LOC120158215 isoform X2 [Hibiscus syriacus]
MEPSPIIFDLSSDDEEATPAWEDPKGDDYNWLSDVLEAVDKVFHDPDDLMVFGEVNPTKKSKSPNSVLRKVAEEDDGDDCVVLEGDPDKASSDVNEPQKDSDECLIVGQKGQCHCFVCDLRAPCGYWGSGTSNTDHCHATDKEEKWKTLRKTFRNERNSPIPVTKAPVTSHSTAFPRLNQAPRRDNMQYALQNQVSRLIPARASRNFIPQIPIQRPSIVRSSSTRYEVPHHLNVGSQHVLNRRMHPHPVSRQLLGVHNTVIRRDRGIKVSNLGPQFVPSNTMSKRMEVASTINRTAFVPSGNYSPIASQHQQNPASVTISNERSLNPIGWPNRDSGSILWTSAHPLSSQPGTDSVITNSAASQSSAYGQPVLQSSLNHDSSCLQNQNQPATNHASSDSDMNWTNVFGQSNQQPSVDYLQLQNCTDEKEASKEESWGHKSVLNELESFLFDDQSFPEDSLTAELNSISSNHMSYDTGMIFFDIESSWDRLTSA